MNDLLKRHQEEKETCQKILEFIYTNYGNSDQESWFSAKYLVQDKIKELDRCIKIDLEGYLGLGDIERDHYHFFSPATMRGFRSRVYYETFKDGRYFITSERHSSDAARYYTIRKATSENIETVGEFQQYASKRAAVSALKRMIKSGELK